MTEVSELKPIVFAPGINRNLTPYNAEGSYMDGDKVRFRFGKAEKIGGWVSEPIINRGIPESDPVKNRFQGNSRDLFSWVDLGGKKYLAQGSDTALEVFEDGVVYDLTPIRETKADIVDGFTFTTGTTALTIDYGIIHDLVVGSRIVINSHSSPIDSETFTGIFSVTGIVSTTEFDIEVPHTFTTTEALGGGGTISISLLLNPGNTSNTFIGGWGVGSWGTEGVDGGGWGDPRSGDGRIDLRQYKLSNWGENLVASVSKGGVYMWSPTDDGFTVRASAILNSPDTNLFAMVVLPSRHIVCFGSTYQISEDFDPLLIKWCASEQYENWDILDTVNDAGEYRLPLGNKITAATTTRSETLVFTDTHTYSMRFVGLPEVFNFTPVGVNSGPVSLHSAVDIDGVVYWMGIDGFYRYDGVINTLSSTLDNYIFRPYAEGRINLLQKEKAYCGVNRAFREITWYYPHQDNEENSRYVTFNYHENTWYDGFLQRNTWRDSNVFDKPRAVDSNGRLFNHEEGKDADAIPMEAFVRSAFFDTGDGTDIVHIDRIIPDLELPTNSLVEIKLFSKKFPNGGSIEKGPFTVNKNTRKINTRSRGRQFSIEYRSKQSNGDFRLGKTRVGMIPDGFR